MTVEERAKQITIEHLDCKDVIIMTFLVITYFITLVLLCKYRPELVKPSLICSVVSFILSFILGRLS